MKIHPLVLVLIFLINIFFVLIKGPCLLTALIFATHLFVCFILGFKVKTFFKLIFLVTFFSLSLFILNYFYVSLDMAVFNFQRAFLLTYISISSSLLIDFEWLLLFLMSKKILSPSKGYPIFAAINSIEKLKEEKRRLDFLAKMRGLNHFRYFFYRLMPLFVFSLRHSQRVAMAMVARGLNDQKVFYFDYHLKKKDYFFGLSFLLVYPVFFTLYFAKII